MLAQELNERLTRVGTGMPMGNLLRHYWHPILASAQLEPDSVKPVLLLGEHLALYRTADGVLGLVAQRCAHRGCSLAYGMPEPNGGIRCAYHGWLYDREGRCTEQPTEPETSTFHNRIRIPAYPVQELGGLIFAYLGPTPAPLLPRWDLLVREDLERRIGFSILPCNWLQLMENSLDPIHFEHLHMQYGNWVWKRTGLRPMVNKRHQIKMEFDVFEYGIQKRRLWEGDSEDTSDDWKVGHPIIFPNTLAQGDKRDMQFQYRIPMDDDHTLHIFYETKPLPAGAPPQASVPFWDEKWQNEDGSLYVETVKAQDMMACIAQGDISDRATERLGSSDKGIILYRSLLLEQIEKVERGEEPMGVIRDPAKNETIAIRREGADGYPWVTGYRTGELEPNR